MYRWREFCFAASILAGFVAAHDEETVTVTTQTTVTHCPCDTSSSSSVWSKRSPAAENAKIARRWSASLPGLLNPNHAAATSLSGPQLNVPSSSPQPSVTQSNGGFSNTVVANSTSTSSTAAPTASLEYEYIVVGSGAGGGVLAARLAELGHQVLLIEAGDDQGSNINTTVPGYQAVVTQDPKIKWDMYVNHYQDLQRAERDPKFVYDLRNGTEYVGLNPPAGATPKGIL